MHACASRHSGTVAAQHPGQGAAPHRTALSPLTLTCRMRPPSLTVCVCACVRRRKGPFDTDFLQLLSHVLLGTLLSKVGRAAGPAPVHCMPHALPARLQWPLWRMRCLPVDVPAAYG